MTLQWKHKAASAEWQSGMGVPPPEQPSAIPRHIPGPTAGTAGPWTGAGCRTPAQLSWKDTGSVTAPLPNVFKQQRSCCFVSCS